MKPKIRRNIKSPYTFISGIAEKHEEGSWEEEVVRLIETRAHVLLGDPLNANPVGPRNPDPILQRRPELCQIARSKWVQRWILRIQAGIARVSSGPLDIGFGKLQDWRSLNMTNRDAYLFRSTQPPSSSTLPTPSVYQAIPTVNIPTTERNIESID